MAPTGHRQDAPGIRILAQFIRDLSFESPHAPESLRAGPTQPQIDLGVELNARARPDGLYDVELKLTARATRDSETVFHIELVYAGLFQIVGVPEAEMEPVLMIECPRYPLPVRAAHRRRPHRRGRLPALHARAAGLRRHLRQPQGRRSRAAGRAGLALPLSHSPPRAGEGFRRASSELQLHLEPDRPVLQRVAHEGGVGGAFLGRGARDRAGAGAGHRRRWPSPPPPRAATRPA